MLETLGLGLLGIIVLVAVIICLIPLVIHLAFLFLRFVYIVLFSIVTTLLGLGFLWVVLEICKHFGLG